jgi:hypothetical protein
LRVEAEPLEPFYRIFFLPVALFGGPLACIPFPQSQPGADAVVQGWPAAPACASTSSISAIQHDPKDALVE